MDEVCLYSHCDPPEDSHTDLVVVVAVVDERNRLDCMEELGSLLDVLRWVSGTYSRLGVEEIDCCQDSKSRLKHVEEKAYNCHDIRVHSNSLAVALLHILETC